MMDRLTASLKYITGMSLFFGVIPIYSILSFYRRHFSNSNKKQLFSFFFLYYLYYKIDKKYYLFSHDFKLGHKLLSFLFEPLYRVNGGYTIIDDLSRFDKNYNYMFAVTPHGVIPFFWFLPMKYFADVLEQPLPVSLGARLIYKIPILRELYLLWSVEGSEENFCKLIEMKRSVAVVPGGIREMILTEPGNNLKIYTKNYGFIRLSLQNGLKLVPVFAFGENNQWFQRIAPNFISEFIIKFTGGAYPFIPWGSFGCVLPNQTPVIHIIGNPIQLPKIVKPTREEIKKYHLQFYQAIAELIVKYKDKVGFSDISVEFIGLEQLNIQFNRFQKSLL